MAHNRHWTYAGECDNIGAGMTPGAELSASPAPAGVRVR
jgi:hypothetical protein